MRIARYWDAAANAAKYGVVEGEIVRELAGHPYREIVKTNNVRPLAATQLLAPCEPTKIIAMWNNFHALAAKLNVAEPAEPLFLLKSISSRTDLWIIPMNCCVNWTTPCAPSTRASV